MPDKGWFRAFDDPIALPDGRKLVTLLDTGEYIPRPAAGRTEGPRMAGGDRSVVLMAAEGRGPLLHARVGILRALNRHVERVFNLDRKETRWGRRKVARDR